MVILAAGGGEARDTSRPAAASIIVIGIGIGIGIVTGVSCLLVIWTETSGAGRGGIHGFTWQPSPLGYLTRRYWPPSALWVIDLAVVATSLHLVIAAVGAAIWVVFAMAREQPCRGHSPGCPAVKPPSSRSAGLISPGTAWVVAFSTKWMMWPAEGARYNACRPWSSWLARPCRGSATVRSEVCGCQATASPAC